MPHRRAALVRPRGDDPSFSRCDSMMIPRVPDRPMSSLPLLMRRRNFPTGQASTAMLKALLRTIVAEKSQSASEAWLRAIRMGRADLDDETRMIPLPTLHHALVAFV